MTEKRRTQLTTVLTAAAFILPIIFGSMAPGDDDDAQPATALYTGSETTHPWKASEVSLPHLGDSLRYVANPDGVVSESTVEHVDATMRRMDSELGIESAIVVVNHVYNDDPFRFSQDLFDLHHIGRDNRGLVVVLAYADHSIRTHTGYALEADLTDVECSRLQNDYLVPWMREQQPDSALVSYAEALYQTLRAKQDPEVTALMPARHGVKNGDDSVELVASDYLVLLWIICLLALAYLHRGKSGGGGFFVGGPSGSGWSRSSGGSWGGGWSGGYGGGGSGGGGATSRW